LFRGDTNKKRLPNIFETASSPPKAVAKLKCVITGKTGYYRNLTDANWFSDEVIATQPGCHEKH